MAPKLTGRIHHDLTETDMLPATNLSDAAIKLLVHRAREIIAGREKPSPIITLTSVGERTDRPNGRWEPEGGSAGAGSPSIKDWQNLRAAYGGYPTACFTTSDGILAVLAWGKEEISAIVAALTDAERQKLVIEFPDPPDGLAPVMVSNSDAVALGTPTPVDGLRVRRQAL